MTRAESVQSSLDLIEEAIRNGKINDYRRAVENHDLSPSELYDAIPSPIANFILACLVPAPFDSLMTGLPEDIQTRAEEVRQLVKTDFGGLLTNPAFGSLVRQATEKPNSKDDPKDALDGMVALKQNPGVSIAADPCWKDQDGKLWPFLRMAFVGASDNTSVVIVADPSDLLLHASKILNFAVNEFERSLPFAEQNLLNFPYPELVANVLGEIRASIDRLEELAPKVGVKISADDADIKTDTTGGDSA